MSDVKFIWTNEKLRQFTLTNKLPVRYAAKIIGCTVGVLAGKRKRFADMESKLSIDPDDWEVRLRETWAQRKARKQHDNQIT